MMSLVKLKNISLTLAKQNILHHINLDIKPQKIITIIGPNGGGKTSLLRILLQVIKPTSGYFYLDKMVSFGYMPQKITIDSTIPLSALDFIALSIKNAQENKFFCQIVEKLNIDKLLTQQLHQLSGGQLQKILLLRTIASQIPPQQNGKKIILVLDEPTQFMDIIAINQFYKIIDDIKNIWQCSVIMVSHDLNIVMQKSDHVFCINQHICCHGTPQDISNHPQYLAIFGKDLNQQGLEIALYQHLHHHKH